MNNHVRKNLYCAGLAVCAGVMLTGCFANKENVLAVTGTVIGVQIHQKDADKTPELKVGYARTEFAFVPTDKGTNGSAADSAEVLMEINAEGSLALGSAYQGGIYQRLAVGKTAVQQPGAAFMMGKDNKGNIDTNTAAAIASTIKSIPAPTVDSTATSRQFVDAYRAASDGDKAKFDAAATSTDSKYSSFNDFITDLPDDNKLKKFSDELAKQGITVKPK